MTTYDRKNRKALAVYKKAQQWRAKQKFPKKVQLLIRKNIEEKRIRHIAKDLKDAGLGDWVTKIGGEFGMPPKFGGHFQQAVMLGLAYDGLPKCIVCGARINRLNKKTCSEACRKVNHKNKAGPRISRTRREESQEKKVARQAAIEKTMLKRYGVPNYTQTKEYSERAKIRNAAISPKEKKAIRERIVATNLRRYGTANPMEVSYIQEKQRRGVQQAYAAKGKKIHKKKENTMLERYGVAHAIHMEKVRHKVFRGKKIVISGKTHFCQGYEELVLRYLAKRGWKLFTSFKGIEYVSDKPRLYFPDAKAVKEGRRLVVEVKSEYTFNWTKANMLKKFWAGTAHAKEHGAEYIVCVVYPKRNLMKVLVNPERRADLNLKRAHIFTL